MKIKEREMVMHEVKIWPDPFKAVWLGLKEYELRKDDRNYSIGDLLRLQEFVPPRAMCQGHVTVTGEFTGNWMLAVITHKTPGGSWGLPKDMCVLGIKILARKLRAGISIQ
jgi:hypothetical protein